MSWFSHILDVEAFVRSFVLIPTVKELIRSKVPLGILAFLLLTAWPPAHSEKKKKW